MSTIKMNWPLVAIGVVVMAVPFSIALIQDLGRDNASPPGDWQVDEPYEDSYRAEERARQRILEQQREEVRRIEEAAALAEHADWQRTAMSEEFFDWLLGSQSDMSDSAIKAEYFGLDSAELRERAPALSDWLTGFDTRFAGATPLSAPANGPLGLIEVTFLDDGSAVRILTNRWGRGELRFDGSVRWIHDHAGLAVTLTGDDYSSEAVLSIAPDRGR